MLKEHGYFVGYTAKGWAPGDPGVINGKRRELLGTHFNDIKAEPPTNGISDIDYTANFEAFFEGQ